MHMSKVFYISTFVDEKHFDERQGEIAAYRKIDYIRKCISEQKRQITVVSTASSKHERTLPFESIMVRENETHDYLCAYGSGNNFLNRHRGFRMQYELLKYFFKRVKENDIVIAYHSMMYCPILTIAKRLIKFVLILELNDLYELHYSDIQKKARVRKKEQRFLLIPDAFILASPYMRELIPKEKSSIVNYGSYDVSEKSPPITPFVSGSQLQTVIYTGVVESMRSSAFLTAQSALFLPRHACMIRIAGYGHQEEIEKLEKLCAEINIKCGYEAVEYVGLLHGKEFELFMQNAVVAINAHTYSESEVWKSKYSFPSKIPLNMSYDLYVVTPRYPVIENSPFAKCCFFIDEMSPKGMAESILIALNETGKIRSISPNELMQRLSEDFQVELNSLLNKYNEYKI